MTKYIAKKDVNFAISPTDSIDLVEGERVIAPKSVLDRLQKHGVIEVAVEEEKDQPKAEEPKETGKDTFDEMSKEDLQKFLDDAEVKYHHKAGQEKLAELARDVAVEAAEKEAE